MDLFFLSMMNGPISNFEWYIIQLLIEDLSLFCEYKIFLQYY